MSHPVQTKNWANFLKLQNKEFVEIEINDKYFLIELKNWHNLVKFAELNMSGNVTESDLQVFKRELKGKADFLHIEPALNSKIETNDFILENSMFRNYYLYTSRIELNPEINIIYSKFTSSNKNNYNKTSKSCEFISTTNPPQAEIDSFYGLYSQSRDGIYLGHTKDYFNALAQSTNDNLLCFTKLGEKFVSTAWIKLDEEKKIAYYFYGGKDNSETLKGISVFLHFEIMKKLKGLGYKYYDLSGIKGKRDTPDPTWAGFTQFKLNFGGSDEKLEAAKDLVTSKLKYRLFRFVKNIRK